MEEELFYPAVGKAVDDCDVMGEAVIEHGEAKHLIDRLVHMEPTDPLYDAMVLVLRDYVHHHVQEEQSKMFPKVRQAKLDLEALGEAILERKGELLVEVEKKGIARLLVPTTRATGKKDKHEADVE